MLKSHLHAVPNLTSGDSWKSIWHTSWPMLLIMLFNFAVGFTDVYVAGLISPEVQASVGFVAQLYFLFIVVANAVGVGTVALVSRAVGAGDRALAVRGARESLLFGVLLGALLSLVGVLFHTGIVSLAGLPEEVRSRSDIFLKIFSLALGPNYLLIISNAVFRAGGEVKKPLFTMFLVGVFNVIGDFTLVFGAGPIPPLGYPGIALSTAASAVLGMAVNLVLLYGTGWREVFLGPRRLSRRILGAVASVAWPAALLQIAWNTGSLVVFHLLGRLGDAGIPSIAAFANGLRIEAVIFLPAFALNMSASILVGQNLGAAEPDRASKVGWQLAGSGMAILSVIAFVMFVFAPSIASLLTDDPAVHRETVRYLRFNMFSEPFMALSVTLGGGLQGAGDSRGPLLVIGSAMWVVRIPLAFFLGITLGWGAPGIWAAMVVSMVFQGLFMAERFHRGRWKTIRLG